MEASLIGRLEKAVERLEALGIGAAPSSAPSGATNVSGPAASAVSDATAATTATPGATFAVVEWEQLLSQHLAPLTVLATHLPSQAQQSMRSFEQAFQATRKVLEVAAVAKKPEGPAELQLLLAPVAEAMGAVSAAAEGRVSCPHHLKVLAEAVGALGFLAYSGHGCGMSTPRQHVADCWQSAEFFSNKLLMEYRGKDENQVAWVRGLKALIQQLEQYVVRNCPTGLRFNPNGVLLAAAVSGAKAVPAPAAAPPRTAAPAVSKPAGARPPPPPPPGPPPKPLSPEELESSDQGGGGIAALFKDLSKGEGITSGLRKVTADMKSKNNPDRKGTVPASSTAPTSSPSSSAGAAAAKKGAPSGPSRLELSGTKWVVENFAGRQDLEVVNTAPKNSVYVYGCTDCVVQIKGKVNAITLDNCRRVGVVFGDVISSAEAVNCNSVQMQTTGRVPTMSVEKTDGAQLYLSQECATDFNFQIVSAKCSAINVVVVPAEGDTSDPQEHPIPEQYITTFKSGKLVTVAAEHSAA